jgi:hypothetical protein
MADDWCHPGTLHHRLVRGDSYDVAGAPLPDNLSFHTPNINSLPS